MPRTCIVCRNPDRDEIDRLLVANEPFRSLESQYGIPIATLYRHKVNDLPAVLVKAEEASEIARADDLISQLKDLQEKARIVWASAQEDGNLKGMLGAIREERATIEQLARLTGLDQRQPQEHQHLHAYIALSAEPLEVRKFFLSNDRWPTQQERRLLLDETPNGDKKH